MKIIVPEITNAHAVPQRITNPFSPEIIQAGGNEFVQRLLTPVSIDTLLLLSDAGWSISRVFRFRSLLGKQLQLRRISTHNSYAV